MVRWSPLQVKNGLTGIFFNKNEVYVSFISVEIRAVFLSVEVGVRSEHLHV